MHIMLIDPPQFQYNPILSNVRLPSSAIIALNSYLLSKGYRVTVVDCKSNDIYFDGIRELVRNEKPDIVGVTGYSCDAYCAMLICSIVKEIDKDIVTAVGGYHVSAFPELTLATCKDIDFCVISEGEQTLCKIVECVESKNLNVSDLNLIEGISFRDAAGSIHRTKSVGLINSLDDLPSGNYCNIDLSKYDFPFPVENSDRRFGFSLSFSRGCFLGCKYCSNQTMWSRKWRANTPARMVSELKSLEEKYGKNIIFFCDNDFLMDRERLEKFLNLLEKEKLDIQWTFETSTDNVLRNADLLPRMKKSGLFMAIVGFESAKPSHFKEMEKHRASLEKSTESAKLLREHGILLFALAMIGFVDEDEHSIKEYAEFFSYLQPDILYTQCLTPLPGTELFIEMNRNDCISSFNFNDYDLMSPVMRYKRASRTEIALWHRVLTKTLFSPRLLELYRDYRYGKIDNDGLVKRYAYLHSQFLRYRKGRLSFTELIEIYMDITWRKKDCGDVQNRLIVEGTSLSKDNMNILVKKLREFDERWCFLIEDGIASLTERETMNLAKSVAKFFPKESLEQLTDQNENLEDNMGIWTLEILFGRSLHSEERDKAYELWRKKSDEYFRIQNSIMSVYV